MQTAACERTVLSIAGSDPSGGAGIQADLKTFTSLGVYGAAAITCLTAQNSMGVLATTPVEPEFVKQQIRLVLEDQSVTQVKTGMIGTAAIAQAITDALDDFTGDLICDPVLKASDGAALLAKNDLVLFMQSLVSRATVLTPNLAELAQLSSLPVCDLASATKAAHSLLDTLPKLEALVLTGGHLNEEAKTVVDHLFLRGERELKHLTATHSRIETANSHGTGCTFASAYAAYRCLGHSHKKSFAQASALVADLLEKSSGLKLGRGNGPLAHYLSNR